MSRLLLTLVLGALTVGVPGSLGADTGSIPATVVPSPLLVSLSLASTHIGPGQRLHAAATVTNVGRARIRDVTLELRSDPTGLSITGRNPHRFSSLASGAMAAGEWSVCGRRPGSFVLVAQARGRLTSGSVATGESEARLLTVTRRAGCRGPRQPHAR